jgi:ssDNA-binding Zn-finger/Zn-ribbon topoisomerase 1
MMMDKYIKSIGNEFVEQGGFRERMSTVRTEARTKQDGVPEEGPVCPNCGSPTRLRKTREGNKRFWGCTGYPSCKGVVNFQEIQSDRNR